MSDVGLVVDLLLAALGGFLVALAHSNLRRSKKLLVDAAKIRASAQEEFECLLKATEALERERAELKFGGAAAHRGALGRGGQS